MRLWKEGYIYSTKYSFVYYVNVTNYSILNLNLINMRVVMHPKKREKNNNEVGIDNLTLSSNF